MTEQKEALKPCPFCGGEAEIEQIGDRRRSTIYACLNCGCRLETGEEWGHGRAWNTRADATENAVLREKLAACDRILLQLGAMIRNDTPQTWGVAAHLLTQIDALTGGDNAEG